MPSKIMACTCSHEDQDKMYGKGMRLHTLSADKKKARCTVCCPSNRLKIISDEPKEKHRAVGMVINQEIPRDKWKPVK